MPRPAFATSLRQFQQQFPDEAACREYLGTFRWPDGFRHNRRKKPMAAFETLLGLGSARGPTPGRLIRRSSRDLATIPDRELTTISGVILNQAEKQAFATPLLVPAGAMVVEATPGRAAPQGGRVTVPMQRGETKLFRIIRA